MKRDYQIPDLSKIREFSSIIMEWSESNLRSYPWRNESQSDYVKLICEVMLQRTKAASVDKVFPDFIKKYPDWDALVNAGLIDLEQALKPLGLYKRRAESLKKLALVIASNNGEIPISRHDIEALPGVGQYIANAVELIILIRSQPLLDVNMARVLERYFGPRELVDIRYDPYLQALSKQIVTTSESPVTLNFAILDFAAIVCKSRPDCDHCRLNKTCVYFARTSSG